MTNHLMPCPHCGGEARWDRYGPTDEEPEMAVNCEGECDGIFVFPKVAAGDWAGLAAVWNARARAAA